MTHHSYNTELSDRILWYDGATTIAPSLLTSFKFGKESVHVTHLTDAVRQYNKNVAKDREISVKLESDPLTYDWVIPNSFKELDIYDYVIEAHSHLMEDVDAAELGKRERRLITELMMYEARGLTPILQSMIWVMFEINKRDLVYGVGRGSSVASYVLYVIGVHDVDSFRYGLDIDEFIRD